MSQTVFVINHHGKPLMPTSPRKARLLLKQGKARIFRHDPVFAIQLLHGSSGYKQPIELGIDSGYEVIGFSAKTGKKEVLCGELVLLSEMSERLTKKRTNRRQRRQRKQYRQPRFDNRRRREGWLAPSIHHKYDSHLRVVKHIELMLPIAKKTIEIASFDIQKIKNPSIYGAEYQHGDQYGFMNIREYVMHRDDHECQNPNCSNRTTQKILKVHHIGYWRGDRTDRPGNLITLCIQCHIPRNHQEGGFLHGWHPSLKSFKPETFMTTVRWRLVNALECNHTYGHVTKQDRTALGLSKTHANDAFVIAGGTIQKRATLLKLEQVRRNNRSLQKFYDAKYLDIRTGERAGGKDLSSGRSSRNKQRSGENLRKYRGHKLSKGRRSIRRQRYKYQPNDIVSHDGQHRHVKGMQNYGTYIKLDGLDRPVRIASVKPVRWRKGICRGG